MKTALYSIAFVASGLVSFAAPLAAWDLAMVRVYGPISAGVPAPVGYAVAYVDCGPVGEASRALACLVDERACPEPE